MITADLLELLRCPQTGQRLSHAGPDVLTRVNAQVGADADGGAMDAALVRADGKVLYRVCGGIPVLLAERAIPL